MANQAELVVGLTVRDATGATIVNRTANPAQRWTPGSLLPKRETVSLTGSAFTALSAPSGAKYVILLLGGAVSLTLKGVTGDSGIALTPASAVTDLPVCIPLGASPSLGILNSGSTCQIDVIWS